MKDPKIPYDRYIFEKEIDDILGNKNKYFALKSNSVFRNYVDAAGASNTFSSLNTIRGWWESSNSWNLGPPRTIINVGDPKSCNDNKNILKNPELPSFMRRAIKDREYRTRLCGQWEESKGEFCKAGKKL